MSPRRALLAAAASVLVLGLAVALWPRELGGSTTFLVIRGASMTPAIRAGDLVLVGSSDRYRVGDVAAYRSTALHHVVLHRIAAIDGATYTFQGDANNAPDPEQVPRARVVGKLDHRLPRVGGALLWLSRPLNAVLIVALGLLLWREAHRRRLPSTAGGHAQPQVVSISDMTFAAEPPIIDVASEQELFAVAQRYDRPVLHDLPSGALLVVVDAATLFRFYGDEPDPAVDLPT